MSRDLGASSAYAQNGAGGGGRGGSSVGSGRSLSLLNTSELKVEFKECARRAQALLGNLQTTAALDVSQLDESTFHQTEQNLFQSRDLFRGLREIINQLQRTARADKAASKRFDDEMIVDSQGVSGSSSSSARASGASNGAANTDAFINKAISSSRVLSNAIEQVANLLLTKHKRGPPAFASASASASASGSSSASHSNLNTGFSVDGNEPASKRFKPDHLTRNGVELTSAFPSTKVAMIAPLPSNSSKLKRPSTTTSTYQHKTSEHGAASFIRSSLRPLSVLDASPDAALHSNVLALQILHDKSEEFARDAERSGLQHHILAQSAPERCSLITNLTTTISKLQHKIKLLNDAETAQVESNGMSAPAASSSSNLTEVRSKIDQLNGVLSQCIGYLAEFTDLQQQKPLPFNSSLQSAPNLDDGELLIAGSSGNGNAHWTGSTSSRSNLAATGPGRRARSIVFSTAPRFVDSSAGDAGANKSAAQKRKALYEKYELMEKLNQAPDIPPVPSFDAIKPRVPNVTSLPSPSTAVNAVDPDDLKQIVERERQQQAELDQGFGPGFYNPSYKLVQPRFDGGVPSMASGASNSERLPIKPKLAEHLGPGAHQVSDALTSRRIPGVSIAPPPSVETVQLQRRKQLQSALDAVASQYQKETDPFVGLSEAIRRRSSAAIISSPIKTISDQAQRAKEQSELRQSVREIHVDRREKRLAKLDAERKEHEEQANTLRLEKLQSEREEKEKMKKAEMDTAPLPEVLYPKTDYLSTSIRKPVFAYRAPPDLEKTHGKSARKRSRLQLAKQEKLLAEITLKQAKEEKRFAELPSPIAPFSKMRGRIPDQQQTDEPVYDGRSYDFERGLNYLAPRTPNAHFGASSRGLAGEDADDPDFRQDGDVLYLDPSDAYTRANPSGHTFGKAGLIDQILSDTELNYDREESEESARRLSILQASRNRKRSAQLEALYPNFNFIKKRLQSADFSKLTSRSDGDDDDEWEMWGPHLREALSPSYKLVERRVPSSKFSHLSQSKFAAAQRAQQIRQFKRDSTRIQLALNPNDAILRKKIPSYSRLFKYSARHDEAAQFDEVDDEEAWGEYVDEHRRQVAGGPGQYMKSYQLKDAHTPSVDLSKLRGRPGLADAVELQSSEEEESYDKELRRRAMLAKDLAIMKRLAQINPMTRSKQPGFDFASRQGRSIDDDSTDEEGDQLDLDPKQNLVRPRILSAAFNKQARFPIDQVDDDDLFWDDADATALNPKRIGDDRVIGHVAMKKQLGRSSPHEKKSNLHEGQMLALEPKPVSPHVPALPFGDQTGRSNDEHEVDGEQGNSLQLSLNDKSVRRTSISHSFGTEPRTSGQKVDDKSYQMLVHDTERSAEFLRSHSPGVDLAASQERWKAPLEPADQLSLQPHYQFLQRSSPQITFLKDDRFPSALDIEKKLAQQPQLALNPQHSITQLRAPNAIIPPAPSLDQDEAAQAKLIASQPSLALAPNLDAVRRSSQEVIFDTADRFPKPLPLNLQLALNPQYQHLEERIRAADLKGHAARFPPPPPLQQADQTALHPQSADPLVFPSSARASFHSAERFSSRDEKVDQLALDPKHFYPKERKAEARLSDDHRWLERDRATRLDEEIVQTELDVESSEKNQKFKQAPSAHFTTAYRFIDDSEVDVEALPINPNFELIDPRSPAARFLRARFGRSYHAATSPFDDGKIIDAPWADDEDELKGLNPRALPDEEIQMYEEMYKQHMKEEKRQRKERKARIEARRQNARAVANSELSPPATTMPLQSEVKGSRPRSVVNDIRNSISSSVDSDPAVANRAPPATGLPIDLSPRPPPASSAPFQQSTSSEKLDSSSSLGSVDPTGTTSASFPSQIDAPVSALVKSTPPLPSHSEEQTELVRARKSTLNEAIEAKVSAPELHPEEALSQSDQLSESSSAVLPGAVTMSTPESDSLVLIKDLPKSKFLPPPAHAALSTKKIPPHPGVKPPPSGAPSYANTTSSASLKAVPRAKATMSQGAMSSKVASTTIAGNRSTPPRLKLSNRSPVRSAISAAASASASPSSLVAASQHSPSVVRAGLPKSSTVALPLPLSGPLSPSPASPLVRRPRGRVSWSKTLEHRSFFEPSEEGMAKTVANALAAVHRQREADKAQNDIKLIKSILKKPKAMNEEAGMSPPTSSAIALNQAKSIKGSRPINVSDVKKNANLQHVNEEELKEQAELEEIFQHIHPPSLAQSNRKPTSLASEPTSSSSSLKSAPPALLSSSSPKASARRTPRSVLSSDDGPIEKQLALNQARRAQVENIDDELLVDEQELSTYLHQLKLHR